MANMIPSDYFNANLAMESSSNSMMTSKHARGVDLLICQLISHLICQFSDQIHKKTITTAPWILDPNGICCFETCDVVPHHPNIKIENQIWIKSDNEYVETICTWVGLVNKKEVIMIQV